MHQQSVNAREDLAHHMHRSWRQEPDVLQLHLLGHALQPRTIHPGSHKKEFSFGCGRLANLRCSKYAVDVLREAHDSSKENAKPIRSSEPCYRPTFRPHRLLVTPVVDYFDLVRRNPAIDQPLFKTRRKDRD